MNFPILYAFGMQGPLGQYEWTYVDRLSYKQCLNLVQAGFFVSRRDETGIWSQFDIVNCPFVSELV